MTISNELAGQLIVALVGIALIVIGNAKYRKRKQLLSSGVKVEGMVSELITESSHSSGGPSMSNYYPVIEYKNSDQVEVSKRYDIGTNPSIYKIGDVVSVIYDANDDREFIIDNKITQWAPPVIIIVGIAVVIGSIIYYILTPDSAAMPPIN